MKDNALRDDVAPALNGLVVMLLQLFVAGLHLDEDAAGPEEVGELDAALELGRGGEVIAGEEGDLGGAGLFRDAILEGGPGLLSARMAEGLEEAVEEGLSLALFIALQGLDESRGRAGGAIWLQRRSCGAPFKRMAGAGSWLAWRCSVPDRS